MNSQKLARTTFVLDRITHEELNYIASRMKVSRSELVRDVLAEPVSLMAKWVRSTPEVPTEEEKDQVSSVVQLDMIEFLNRTAAEIKEARGS
jgi:hypothetical protein